MEVEYRGYDPLEALRVVQERQIQEFTQFRKLLRQLKFELKTEDYFAWKRCLKEYDLAKRNFIKTARRMKLSFQGQLKSLMARNLAADQYQMELQNLLQQFQTEFTPSVESFHTNIKNLFETIRDEKRRKKWWSTVKTTEITTGPDGTQTRTSLTQTSSGIGGQQTGYSKSSESNSIAGGLLGGPSSVEYKTSSMAKTKIGTVVGGSGGYVASGSQSESSSRDIDEDNDSDDKDSGSSKYSASQSQESKTGDNGASSSKESSQESTTGDYGANSSEESSQVSKESKYSAKGAKSAGSFGDNNQINFSQVQTRTGLKEGYGTSQSSKEEGVVKKSGYAATSGGYRRRRRTLGLLAGALGAKRSALSGGGGGDYGGNGGGAGVGVNVGVGLGAGGGGGGSGAGVAASARVGFGGGGGAQNHGGQGGGFKAGSNFEGGSSGFQGGSSGVQRGSFKGESGFKGGSGGFQSGPSGFQGDGSKYSKSMSGENSIDGNFNSRGSLSGDYNLENNFQGGKVSKTVKKEKSQETQMSMSGGSDGYGY